MASSITSLVWLVDSQAIDPDALASYAAWLAQSERDRCARFVRPERRLQFIVGRALLRSALGRLLDRAPETILLHERAGLAPALPDVADVGFSISHSGRWVACAAGRGVALGLDIERSDPARDVMALAEQAFDAQEVRALQAQMPEARHAAFYRMWCAYEARIKLARPSVAEYSLEAGGLAGVLACDRPLAQAPVLTPVRLHEL